MGGRPWRFLLSLGSARMVSPRRSSSCRCSYTEPSAIRMWPPAHRRTLSRMAFPWLGSAASASRMAASMVTGGCTTPLYLGLRAFGQAVAVWLPGPGPQGVEPSPGGEEGVRIHPGPLWVPSGAGNQHLRAHSASLGRARRSRMMVSSMSARVPPGDMRWRAHSAARRAATTSSGDMVTRMGSLGRPSW